MTATSNAEDLAAGLIPKRGTSAMVRGEGCWLWNSEGSRFLDLTSGHGVAPLGHCHPALRRAIGEQAGRLISLSASFLNDRRGELLESLRSVLPEPFEHVFLCNSGTEAIEAGLKFAFLATGRSGAVALKQGFHGRTLGSLAVTWNPNFRGPFAPLLRQVSFVTPGDIEGLESSIDDDTGVVVAEIIQGESGVIPIAADFLLAAQRLCHERGALLLVDEIQTGFGRTGEWFAHSIHGLEPDMMAMAKGIAGGFPMGALASTAQVAASLKAGLHGTTFGGSPLASAAACATIDTLAAENLVARAAASGAKLIAMLRAELEGLPLVKEVRGRGLMIGIDLRQRVGPYLDRLMNDHQVLALPAGPTVLRLLPALILDDDQIELAVEAIVAVLSQP